MTHTEESLIELADAAMWQASLQSGDDKYKALRLAIREVLAKRDRYLDIIRREAWLEHASENDVESPYVPFTDWVAEKKRAERAEAELDERPTKRLWDETATALETLRSKFADLQNECERLRKDAERWNTALANCEVYGPRGVISTVQEFDATFDTAIAQEKSKDKPAVNSPVDCEFRPLYAAHPAVQGEPCPVCGGPTEPSYTCTPCGMFFRGGFRP